MLLVTRDMRRHANPRPVRLALWKVPLLNSFNEFGLTEPILRALVQEKYVTPTPIQAQTIPSALTGREELISVTECADSARSNCLLPTSTNYQGGSPGVSTVSNTALSSAGALLTAKYDFNGDGYPDLLYNPTGNGAWYVAFGSASGYGTPVNTGITGAALPGNLNGGI